MTTFCFGVFVVNWSMGSPVWSADQSVLMFRTPGSGADTQQGTCTSCRRVPPHCSTGAPTTGLPTQRCKKKLWRQERDVVSPFKHIQDGDLWLRFLAFIAVLRIREDPYFFGCPGSDSTRYGSGSGPFYQQAKVVRKTFFLLFCDFFMTFDFLKMM